MPIEGRLAGARFTFQTDAPDLAAYARAHFGPLLCGADRSPDVAATLRWHDGQPPRERTSAVAGLASMERLDRDLYAEPGRLHWFRVDDLRDLHLSVSWDGERLSLSGDYFHRLSNVSYKDRAKRLLYGKRIERERRRRYTTILYYLVYYGCFWWLERMHGVHPIHAAGVEVDGGVIVLAGPSGVGKSTLSAAVAAEPGARFLSDTFVLHDEQAARPVYEPMLVDAWSRTWLGTAAGELRPIDWKYCLSRDGFHWNAGRLGEGGAVRTIIFPRRAAEHYVRPISAGRAHALLSAGDMIINDLRRYWAYAAVLEMLAPTTLVLERERKLAALTAAVPCFELGLTAQMDRPEAVARIRELAAEPRGRARRVG